MAQKSVLIILRNLKIWLIAAAVLLTALLSFAAGRSFINYRKETADLRRFQARLAKLERDYGAIEKLLEQYAAEQEKFEELLFKEQDVPLFLEEVSRFALDSKAKIVDIKAQAFAKVKYSDPARAEKAKKKKADGTPEDEGFVLSYLPVQVSVQGSFDSIVAFLFQLEKYKQLLTLTDVEIKDKEYPLLSCSLIVNIYSLRDMNAGMNK